MLKMLSMAAIVDVHFQMSLTITARKVMVIIVAGIYLYLFRTEELSPLTSMILQKMWESKKLEIR